MMEKSGVKKRTLQFFSKKNNEMRLVNSSPARAFAKHLEEQSWVKSYETCRPLEVDCFSNISRIGIRSAYFDEPDWVSDFYICYADGNIGVREITTKDALQKKTVIEKLELSRRYWSLFTVDWKVLLIEDVPATTGG